MYDRQDSNSQLNIFIHMDDPSNTASYLPATDTCTTYAIPGVFTFSSDGHYTSVISADKTSIKMSTEDNKNSCENSLFQSCCKSGNRKQLDNTQNELCSPGARLYEGTNFTPKDDKIFEAVNEALNSGSLTPLIKEELKCSIQSRRLKEGKRELTVAFEEPKQYQVCCINFFRFLKER